MKVAILGAGSWGTALGIALSQKSIDVNLWTWKEDQAKNMKSTRLNSMYLPNVSLPKTLCPTTDMEKALEEADMVLSAVPSQVTGSVLEKTKPFIKENVILVNVSKGIELTSLRLMSEVTESFFPKNSFVALSGPSHAEEVAQNLPTTLVASSKNLLAAQKVQDAFSTSALRVYTNPDLVGVEIGGALKNIIALGAGISDGLGNGDNAKAALMTRGIHEIARLGMEMGAKAQTFSGLTGIGDLVVTCTSMHSRNRRCGILIGQGLPVEEAVMKVGMVVEGVDTVKSAYALSRKYNVEMPITEQLYKILYENFDAKKAVEALMRRDKTKEMEHTSWPTA